MNKKPLVSARTITYNHAPYIRNCIEGVLMQKTNFPIEYIIGEDCSTDGTREIVFEYAKKYSNLIKVVTSDTNVGANANAKRAFDACNGKYIAICEGDDYWTDPLKLQKQVDFLEANPDYGLVHTDNSSYFQSTGELILSHKANYFANPPSGFIFNTLIKKNFISTLTVVVRTDIIKRALNKLMKIMDISLIIDYSIWLEISRNTKIKYIKDITTVYRISNGTISRPTDINEYKVWLMKSTLIQDFFIKYYKVNKNLIVEIKNERIINKLRIQYRKKYFEKRFEKPIEYIKTKNIKDKLLFILYKFSSPRVFYVLLELPFIFYRRIKKIKMTRVHLLKVKRK